MMQKTAGILLVILAAVSFQPLHSEGTKQLMPTSTDWGMVKLASSIAGNNTRFAMLDGPIDYRLNVSCLPGEKVYMGFKAGFNVKVTVKAPDRSIAYGPQTITNSGNGYIANYNQAVAGPNTIAGGNGYAPFTFNPTTKGDYSIEFEVSGLDLNDRDDREKTYFDFFDVTVVDANNNVKLGRLWSKAWDVVTNKGDLPFNGSFFVYTNDGVVSKVDLNGIKPNEFVFSANNRGTTLSGTPLEARKSKKGLNETFPLYKVFLNDPDTLLYPSGSEGKIIGKPTLTRCPGDYCINVNITAPGDATVILDLNGTPDFQAGTADKILTKSLVAGSNCISWNGLDGLGQLFTDIATIRVNVKYLNGETHIPMYDVETNENGFEVTYIRPRSTLAKTINMFWDDTNLNNGKLNTSLPCTGNCNHQWPKDYGDQNTVNTWWYIADSFEDLVYDFRKELDANDKTPGKGNSNDTTICASVQNILLHASVFGESGVKWEIISGSGLFSNDTTLKSLYKMSNADSLLPFVHLRLSTSGGNCPSIHDSLKIIINKALSLSISPSDTAVCEGASVHLRAFGAINYKWNNGSVKSDTSFTVSASGSYSVNGSSNGCKGTATANVTVKNKPIVTISPLNPTVCLGDSVRLNASGAATYLWQGGSKKTDTSFVPSPNQSYEVIGQAANGCRDTTSTTVGVKTKPSVSITPSSSAICKGDTSTLTAQGAHHYRWQNGGSSQDTAVSPISDQSYLVIGTTSNGCKDTAMVTVTVHPTPLLPTSTDQKYCVGEIASPISSAVSSTPGLKFYQSPHTAVEIPGSTVPSTLLYNLPNGKTYYLQVVDMHLCKSPLDSFKVMVDTLPLSISPLDTVVCEGATIKLSASGATNYKWNNGSPKSDTTFTATITNSYFVTGNTNGCKGTATARVTVKSKPIVMILPTNPSICKGDSIQLNASGAINYTWKNGSRTSDTTVSPISNQYYEIIGVASNGCEDTANVTVAVNPSPLPPSSVDQFYCVGDIATPISDATKAVPGLKFYTTRAATLEIPSTTTPNTSINNHPKGTTYYLRIVDANSCESPLDSFKVWVDQAPTGGLLIGDTSLCEGEKRDYVVTQIKSLLPISYSWSNGTNGASIQSSKDSLGSYLFISDPLGTIAKGDFLVDVSNKCGKVTLSKSVRVLLKPRPTTDKITGNFEFCELAQSNTYKLAPQQNVTRYNWIWNNILQSSKIDSVTVQKQQWQGGTQPYIAVVPENSCGLGDTIKEQTIIEAAKTTALTLQASKTTICHPQESVTFATQTKQVNGPAIYSFYVNGAVKQQSSTDFYIAPEGSLPDKSEIFTTIEVNGCYNNPLQKSNTVVVNSFERPDSVLWVVSGRTKICEIGDGPVVLRVNPSKGNTGYEWYKDGIRLNETSEQLTLSRPSQSGKYHVRIYNQVCPQSQSKDTLVKIFEMPKIEFAQNPMFVKYSQPNQKAPIIVTQTGLLLDTPTSIQWSPSQNLSSDSALQPDYLIKHEEAMYSYALTVKTGDVTAGCSNTFPLTVLSYLDIAIPNAFSPNGDGLNDTWVIQGISKYPQSKVSIFNRWGNKVYTNDEGYKAPWDGNYNGLEVATATYYYVIDLKGSLDQTDRSVQGSVTIVK